MYHVIIWKITNFSHVPLIYENRLIAKKYYEFTQQSLTLALHPKVRHKNNDCFGLEVRFACLNKDECIHLQFYIPDEEVPQLYILDESIALSGAFKESPDCTLQYGNPRKNYRLKFKRIIPRNLLKSSSSKICITPNDHITTDILSIVCKVLRHRKSKRKITELDHHPADFYSCRMNISDLEYLSTDFGALLQSGLHSDMTIVVNKDHFKVHRFILQSRCPEFYHTLVKLENFTDTYTIQNIDDASLLWSILQCIYTGIYLPVLDNEEMSEILEAKSHHGLKYVVPFNEVIVTDYKQLIHLVSDKIVVNYYDLELNVEEDCLHIFPFPHMYSTNLKVSLFKGLDDENYFWICFKFQKEKGEKDMFMHCEIEIEQKDKSKQMLKEIEHFFKERDEFLVTSVKVEKSNVDKFLHDGNFHFVFTTRTTLKGVHFKSTRSVYKYNEVVVEKTKASHCKHIPSINAHDYCKNETLAKASHSKHTHSAYSHNNDDKSAFERKLKELQLKNAYSYNYSNSDQLNQLWKNYEKSWKTLFKEKTSADLILQVGDETVQVHKAVLCSRSEVFLKMFEHKTIENQRNIVEIQGIDLNTLNSLLSYMYCGSIDCSLTVHKAIWLYIAADRYFIERLKNICRQYLSNYIYYGEYFFDIKVLSVIHNDAQLQRLTSKIPSTVLEKKLTVLENETLYLSVLNSLDIIV